MGKRNLYLNDTAAVQLKLDEVQARARLRCLSAECVQGEVRYWEKKSGACDISTQRLNGVQLHIQASGEKFAKAYNGSPKETCVDVRHNGREWVVVDVYRDYVKSHNWTVTATLTTDAEAAFIKRLLTA